MSCSRKLAGLALGASVALTPSLTTDAEAQKPGSEATPTFDRSVVVQGPFRSTTPSA
jgi:hypothetical protein